ncbi:MAG: 2-isopropylmalate synthase [bacterium]|nr:2-isopropylmalate synthase [bacterium]
MECTGAEDFPEFKAYIESVGTPPFSGGAAAKKSAPKGQRGRKDGTKTIRIFDTTLRDGEQSPGAAMSVEQKVKMASALDQLGVNSIEAGFPVSSPVQFEAVKRISESLTSAAPVALARCVKKDIDAAHEALGTNKNRMLHVFIATSPLHREFKLKLSKEQILTRIAETLDYARYFFTRIEFSAEDASRTEPGFLYKVIRTAIAHGATVINIPDTVGYAMPVEFGDLIRNIRLHVPEIAAVDLSVHCHNDLGLAVANSISAVLNGADQVEVTMNGIGERAGNCPLEELVMAFDVRKKLLGYHTSVNTRMLHPTSRLLQNITGLIVPRNKPIFGDNAFAHESGIHQDGVLKHRETYEIMNPEAIGRSAQTLAMGRHSGRHSFSEKLEAYNISLSEEQFQEAFNKFTQIADRKKEVYDEDILNIAASVLGRFNFGYRLKHFQANTGSGSIPTATVKICKDNTDSVGAAPGDGPVDALFQAVDSALGIATRLKEYVIQAVGAGKDAQGMVKLAIEIDGKEYQGRGTSTDIIEASGLAHLNAVNRYMFHKEKGYDKACEKVNSQSMCKAETSEHA